MGCDTEYTAGPRANAAKVCTCMHLCHADLAACGRRLYKPASVVTAVFEPISTRVTLGALDLIADGSSPVPPRLSQNVEAP